MGAYTTNNYFYKPALGATGETEMGYFDAALDAVDLVIKANLDAKHNQNADTDLDATFEATFMKKADSLSDISNVGADTPTDKYALMADGDSWESRALVEADISDLGTAAAMVADKLSVFAATTSAELAGVMSDETGTGKAVFATSPTLVTPLLGTPTSGVVTNLTGVFSGNLSMDHTLGSDEDYSGITDSAPVGETVAIGDLLYYDWTDVEWKKAKADAIGTTPAMRIALEVKDNGETCLMLVEGYIRDDSAFDFGAARVYLNDDTAGTCDDTAPAESGDQIQLVGIAVSADILWFNPSIDIGEI